MEYQYYEFRAIDKPLTKDDQNYVKSLSSRVYPTAHRAVFTYSHGDFHGKPLSVLERCFDAMLYMASWASYQLAFRFPTSAIDPAALQPYCLDHIIEVSTTKQYVILNINIYEEEKGIWIDEDANWLDDLLPLRQAILQGDYRILYLAWLKAAAGSEWLENDSQEPPVPPNLKNLNAPVQSFITWLELDPNLVAVAADNSPDQQDSKEPFKDWINALSEAEKTKLLLEIVEGESAIAGQIQARLRQKFAKLPGVIPGAETNRRSFSQLEAQAKIRCQQQKAQEEAAATAKRQKHLTPLKSRQGQIWQTVHDLLDQKKSNLYDQAVQHLVELRDLAQLEGTSALFRSQIYQLERQYSSRSSLLKRMQVARLLK